MPIKNIKQMWDATILHYKNGDADTLAMKDINSKMTGSLSFQDMANVFSGVYADTYWNGISMDPNIMATNLNSSIKLNKNDALVYAKNAMKTWRGLYCRDSASDTGTMPRPGYTCNSIDICCTGGNMIDTDTLLQNWNTRYWTVPKTAKNYAYVRCQNINFLGETITNTAKMYMAPGGMNQGPNQWVPMVTANGSQTGNILVLGGQPGPMASGVAGVSEAFIFQPKSTEHVCIAAVVCSDYFTQNDPSSYSGGNWNTYQWITNNGAAAWINTNPQLSSLATLKFYNQDNRPETFAFEAHCKKVPAGTKISLKCNDNAINGLETSGKISNDYQIIGTEVVIPANYEGDLEVMIETPDGSLLPDGSAVEVKMLWNLARSHKNYIDAADALGENDSARVGRNIRVTMGSFTLYGTK